MSLASLFAAYGMRPERVAEVLGISPFVFDRIDSGRQGLPDVLVPRIAAIIGATDAEVRSNASRIIAARSWPRSGVATPVRPDLNEPIPHVLLHPIPPVPLHPREEVVPRLVFLTLGAGMCVVERLKKQPNGERLLAMLMPDVQAVPEDRLKLRGMMQFLVAIDTTTRSLASVRDVSEGSRDFNAIHGLAFDGERVWVTNAAWGTGIIASTSATQADAPFAYYTDWQFGPSSTGAAAVEYADTTSGLWKTNEGWGEVYSHDLQRIDPATGSPIAAVPIVVSEIDARPITCTVVGGKVFTIAMTTVGWPAEVRFVRVDPGTATQEAVSTGYDFSNSWSMFRSAAQVAATTLRADAALWIQEPGSPFGEPPPSAILRCDQDTMVVSRILTSDDIGMWSGGADADADGNLWFTGIRFGDGVLTYISKVARDGTVLARITQADVPGMDQVGPLVVDRANGVVWAYARILDPELGQSHCVLRIEVASAAVTDTIVVMTDTWAQAFDMVVGGS